MSYCIIGLNSVMNIFNSKKISVKSEFFFKAEHFLDIFDVARWQIYENFCSEICDRMSFQRTENLATKQEKNSKWMQ